MKIAISFSNTFSGGIGNGIDRVQVKRTSYLESLGIKHYIINTAKDKLNKENHLFNFLFSETHNILAVDNNYVHITNDKNDIIIDNNNSIYKINEVNYTSYYQLVTFLLKKHIPEDTLCFFDWFDKPINFLFLGVKHTKTIGVIHSNHIYVYFPELTANHQLWNREFNYYITTNDAQTVDLKKRFPEKASRIHTVVPVEEFGLNEPIPKEDKHSFGNDTIQLVTASYLERVKRIDHLIHIMKVVIKDKPNVHLNIFGIGSEAPALEALAKELNIEDNIHFHGKFTDPNVMKHYDVYVSTSPSEAFATVLLEAMSVGLPVIAFDVPFANQNYITSGYNGYLVPYGLHTHLTDTERYFEELSMFSDFANVIKKLTKESITTLGTNAKKFVSENYFKGRALADYYKLVSQDTKTPTYEKLCLKYGDECSNVHINDIVLPIEWSFIIKVYKQAFIYDLDNNLIAKVEFDSKFPVIQRISWK